VIQLLKTEESFITIMWRME